MNELFDRKEAYSVMAEAVYHQQIVNAGDDEYLQEIARAEHIVRKQDINSWFKTIQMKFRAIDQAEFLKRDQNLLLKQKVFSKAPEPIRMPTITAEEGVRYTPAAGVKPEPLTPIEKGMEEVEEYRRVREMGLPAEEEQILLAEAGIFRPKEKAAFSPAAIQRGLGELFLGTTMQQGTQMPIMDETGQVNRRALERHATRLFGPDWAEIPGAKEIIDKKFPVKPGMPEMPDMPKTDRTSLLMEYKRLGMNSTPEGRAFALQNQLVKQKPVGGVYAPGPQEYIRR